jgi:flagellin-like hook-associated protein FlgL
MTGLYVASNPTALSSQFSLVSNMGGLADTLERLSTGLRINSGKDDPAGLIASSMLKAEITGTTKAITNTQRAISMIATADSSLGQINSLLTDIKGLVVEGANSGVMNAEMIAANQMQINAAIGAIDKIAKQTSYNGQKLLDGSMSFRTRSTINAGDPNNIGMSDLQINAANFGTSDTVGVNVQVQETARRGTLYYNGTGVSERTTFDVTGSIGTQSFTFGAGATNSQIAEQVNRYSDATGVRATVEGMASRGTAVLSTAGANNDIVITAKEEGKDQGNYSFKVVYGDQEGARIASQATENSTGVVEIMLRRSYHKNYENFAGILNVDINAGTTGTDATTSSVTIKKGAANSAIFHETDAGATGSNTDGTRSLTITGITGAAAGSGTAAGVAYDDMSMLNGWTVVIGNTAGTNAADIDFEAKVITTHATDNTSAVQVENAIGIGITRITGQSTATVLDNTGMALTGTVDATNPLAIGERFVLGGGGAARELDITYAEGATVDDIMKLINKSGSNASASLAQGVKGDSLIKDLVGSSTNPTRVSTTSDAAATRMSLSKTTSTATANHVIDILKRNAELNSMFDFELLSGDSGDGLVGYMDGSVISGDVNLDNAIRFMGMDSGPIVRMVTTDNNGDARINQKLSVTLINPSEADLLAGRNTPILQINLATDSSGNSTTTAKDIVNLFKTLTPDQTGGISAVLQLPDGVDPNGRIWSTDECGNVTLIENCDANYGLGIVQPTGVPGTCDIQQNDLVILGQNQTMVDTNTIARIGNSAVDGSGGGITSQAAIAYADANNNIQTVSNHEGLNGVTITFVANDNLAGFDEEDGVLRVFISPETMAQTANFSGATGWAANAVNGAIAQNWQGIRQFTNAVGGPTTVTVNTNANSGTTLLDAFDNPYGTSGLLGAHFLADDETFVANYQRGRNENSAALIIESIGTGTDTAGVKVYLVQDDSLKNFANDASATGDMIKVSYDEKTGELTIKANMNGLNDGPVSSGKLAELLNANDDFRKYFTATGNLVGATTAAQAPNPSTANEWAGVYFSNGYTAAGEFVGGREIQTAEKATGGSTNDAETSSGIAMTGGSDDNQRLRFEATETGSRNFVQISVAEGSFRTFCPQGNELSYLAGTDAVATINGLAASADGNKISIDTTDLSMSMNVENRLGYTSFNITGGGAILQTGPNVVSAQQMRLGIGSMLSTQLGGTNGKLFQLKSGGDADITKSEGSRVLADAIVNDAISYVANVRGRLGAIQRSSLEPNVSMLQDSLLALSEANQQIEEADFAEESSNLTRYQLLIQSGMQGLSLANTLPQYAASLVRG